MSNLLKRIALFKVCEAKFNYKMLNPKNWKRPSFKKIIKGLIILAIFLAAVITIRDEVQYQLDLGYYAEEDMALDEEQDCNVTGIELQGEIVTYLSPENQDDYGYSIVDQVASENLIYAIQVADIDDSIKAILVKVDSYGGSAVAAEEISNALKRAKKPTVALIRNAATSAAYWASTGAEIIFASALSDVGGIGVTMSYTDNSKKNESDGLTYNSLATGKFKDYTSSDKPLTTEEKQLLMRDLNIMHDLFVRGVADNRRLPLEKVKALADGSSMPGQMALDNGLIDRIGGMDEVRFYLKGIIGEEVGVCW